MLDHVGLTVLDFARSRAFYAAALAPLGYAMTMEVTKEQTGSYEGAGFGTDGQPSYGSPIPAGCRDNGPPGLREHYHPNYYGAFVLDLDGNNVEAVCHS